MAIYCGPVSLKNPRANECGITMQFAQGPPMAPSGWLGIFFYFQAQQVSWGDDSGTGVAGGHFGLQWGNTESIYEHCHINFGVYDDVIGGGAVLRGSWPDPNTFPGDGTESYRYHWVYGDIIKFRCFKSPKQTWTAAELTDGFGQIAPYIDTDQQSNETAYRVTVQKNYDPPVFFRDVLIKNARTVKPLQGPIHWLEASWSSGPTDVPTWPDGDFPYDPIIRFKDFNWDGRKTCSANWVSTYNAWPPHSDCSVVGDWIEMKGGNPSVTRVTADGSQITPGSTFWTPSPSNVTPNPSLDVATRIATPRPWF